MSTFVVDTHALVWYLDKDKKLSKNAVDQFTKIITRDIAIKQSGLINTLW